MDNSNGSKISASMIPMHELQTYTTHIMNNSLAL